MPEGSNQYPHADLEFGVFDWLDRAQGRSVAQVYEERLKLLRRADAGAFSRYHLAEHHGTPLGLAPSPAVFLAAAARETGRIRLAATTFIVPLYDPLRLTEEIGMLDQLSGGRLEIGIGKGSSPHEAAIFGHTSAEMAQRYDRLIPTILDALRTGRFVPADGEPVELFVRPVQTPHPPLWYPTSNPTSIPRLARDSHHTIFGFGFVSPPLEQIREHSRTFFAIREQADAEHLAEGAANGGPRFGMLRHVHVGDTDGEAMAAAREAFAAHYDSFSHLWRKAGSDRFSEQPDMDELVDSRLLFAGSPGTVAGQVADAVAAAEVNYVAGAFAWGSLSERQALRSLELFDEQVIPQVRHLIGQGSGTTTSS